jgi:hypothetical protein
MNKLVNLCNKIFYNFIFNDNEHVILQDLEILENRNQFSNIKLNNLPDLLPDLPNLNMEQSCKYKSSMYLDEELIYTLYNNIKHKTIQREIEQELDKIIYYNLPSTLNDLDDLKYLLDIRKTNILILGAGPNGLFLANYLNLLYNNKVNILVLDNRTSEESYREPYIRSRTFAIGVPSYFSLILPKITCFSKWVLIQIRYLEILLYLKSFTDNIPMYFTKKYSKYGDVQKLIKKYNFKVCFDSTGGRIKTPFVVKNFKFPDNFKFKKNNHELILENNLLKINWLDNKHKKYLFIYFLNKNFKSLFINYYDVFPIMNDDDYKLLNNICIDKKHISHIIKKIIDIKLKKFLITILNMLKDDIYNNISYINLTTTEVKLYSQLKIAFLINNKKCAWIGAGDTIFHSHYLLGSGLTRTLTLSSKIINLLELIL